jgi:multidrug efflux system membrane fusion protein
MGFYLLNSIKKRIKNSKLSDVLNRLGTLLHKKRQEKPKAFDRTIKIGGPVVLIALIWGWHAFAPKKIEGDHTAKTKATSVVMAQARTMDVPVYLMGLGSVTPPISVTVKTQVAGLLTGVLFQEGQLVKEGDLLIKIDSRFYEAQLLQAEGQLGRDQALLVNAKLDLKRYKGLYAQDSVSKQILDTQISLVKQYEGTVKLDQGLVDSARVTLSYCKIFSPTHGRVGLRLVDPGNFVQPTDLTGMVIINKTQPMTVIFTLPEDTIPQVLDHMKQGSLLTEAFDRGQDKHLATGKLVTLDNQIDPTTGTVKLRAEFQNEKDELFPSQFVNIKLLTETLKNATVVPTAAIQHGVHGSYVFRVLEDFTVKITPVTVGIATGNNTLIKEGLSPGQIVVTEGTDKLSDGTVVKTSSDNNKKQAKAP